MAHGLPVILRLEGRSCVIVGGGAVALRRAGSLADAGAKLTVIAPCIAPAIRALAIQCHERPYQRGDLEGAALVVIATDDEPTNAAVAEDARTLGVPVNRADDPDAGDVVIPAHAHHGPVTVAVYTSGISASAAAAIRRQLSAALDPDWPRLLAIAAAFRDPVQRRFADASRRQARLRQLTDEAAMTILKQRGDEALRSHLQRLTEAP